MNKAIRKFVISAEGAVFVLLAVLLSVINVVNFAMASDDADMITKRLAGVHGMFETDRPKDEGAPPAGMDENGMTNQNFHMKGRFRFGGFDMMGPDSPEMNFSLRYFTYSFDKEGNAEKVVFKMSAVSEEEARAWAESLINGSTGWTRVNYRYRVYKDDEKIYVTVIDQGRELLPSYRILIISVCGGLVLLICSGVILAAAARKIFKPIAESDRKQKQFITNVENEFKVPLTIINANTEIIEKQNGPAESTNIINKQVRKMTAIVKDLSSLSVFDENDMAISKVNLSDIMNRVMDSSTELFKEKNISLESQIENDIMVEGDEIVIKKALNEMIDNSLKFAKTEAVFKLQRLKNRIILRQENDTSLKDGSIDQIFDRFTMLENAQGKGGIGLGLSYVKQAVLAHNGRVSARVSSGRFVLQIDL